jgi:hypothetical protein
MGKLASTVAFTGSIESLTAYKRQGVDGIVVQKKGGPTKKMVKTSPNYDVCRRRNMEFGGRATMSKWVMRALWSLKPVGDYNIAGPLNRILKSVQDNDKVSELGKRNVRLSALPHVLEGFQLNKRVPLESVLRTSFSFSVSRETGIALVTIPELIPGINLVIPDSYPWYSFHATLGVVPDLFLIENGYKPSDKGYSFGAWKFSETPWAVSTQRSPGASLELRIDLPRPNKDHTLMLSVGILFGKAGIDGKPQQVRHVGCAKILMIV